MIFNESIRGGVPSGIATGFKGGAQSAGRETGSIRFALDQLLTGELHDYGSISARCKKAVVLLSGNARHRLEPMRIMCRAFFNGPVLHRVRDDTGHTGIQFFAKLHGPFQCAVSFFRQTLPHDGVSKYHIAEEFGNIAGRMMGFRIYSTHDGSSSIYGVLQK